MTKNKLLTGLASSLVVFLLLSSPALAVEMAPVDNSPTATVAEPEPEDEDELIEILIDEPKPEIESTAYPSTFFTAGESVLLSDHYLSDVIVAGQTVTLSPAAVIEGDLIAAAQTINLYGTVKGDIRAAASAINFSQTTVEKNATLFAGQITTDIDTSFGQDLSVFGGTLNLNSPVKGDLWAGAGELTLNSPLGGTVYIQDSGLITLGPGAKISGDLNYASEKEASLQPGAEVKGAINYTPSAQNNQPTEKSFFNIGKIFWEILKIFSLLLIGLILIYFFPQKFQNTAQTMFTAPGASFLWGILFLILTPLVCLILAFTLIGLPLALLGFIFYGLAMYLAPLFFGFALGQKIMPKVENLFWPMVLGTFIFCLARLIPWIGGIIGLIGVVWVIGAHCASRRQIKKTKK